MRLIQSTNIKFFVGYIMDFTERPCVVLPRPLKLQQFPRLRLCKKMDLKTGNSWLPGERSKCVCVQYLQTWYLDHTEKLFIFLLSKF